MLEYLGGTLLSVVTLGATFSITGIEWLDWLIAFLTSQLAYVIIMLVKWGVARLKAVIKNDEHLSEEDIEEITAKEDEKKEE